VTWAATTTLASALIASPIGDWERMGFTFDGDYERVEIQCPEMEPCGEFNSAVRISQTDFDQTIQPQIAEAGYRRIGYIDPLEGVGRSVSILERRFTDDHNRECRDVLYTHADPVTATVVLNIQPLACADPIQ
jgi:hypothetical protein